MKRMPERDLRAYGRATHRRLILGGLVLVFAVGDGLVWLLYGKQAGKMALTCTGLGLGPVVLIALVLEAIGWFVRKTDGQ